ncbi:tetratricopeptide repeat protein [Massilia sp. PWRC2]|uniref:tetratricopeptide repeat protein n=1 Tax=Massilia sp. PWRC2 TaxID=2804626 RepID=UPI003CFA2D64
MNMRSFAAMTVVSGMLATGLLMASPAVLAQEVSIHQVYEAAEAGKFIEAQKLMDQVLAAHPNSPKAHFIEAELLAKQGKMARAATELATAERLGPDLKFAKPEALQRLKAVLAAAKGAANPAANPASVQRSFDGANGRAALSEAPAAGPPWGLLLGIGALVLLAVMFFKRKAAQAAASGGFNGGAYNGGAPQYPQGSAPGQYPPGAAPPQYGGAAGYGAPAAPAGGVGGLGGMGSGILGGLATGAALGAGMVAGQALAHRFTDSGQSGHEGGNRSDSGASGFAGGALQNDTPPSGYDMGGSDFGVTDSGSWDSGSDGGGGGSSDWD